MNRADLIDQIRDRLGVDKRAAETAVDAVFDTIQRAVATGEKVALTGFGVFEKVERAARTGRNPRTGATVKIKKTAVPKFRPGTQFKGVVSGAVKLGKVADAAAKTAAKGAAKKAGASTAKATKATKATKAPAKKAATKAAPAKKSAAKAAKKAPAKKATKR